MSKTVSKKELTKEGLRKALMEAHKKVMNDPEVKKRAEEYVRKYGTLTPEELAREFTI